MGLEGFDAGVGQSLSVKWTLAHQPLNEALCKESHSN